MIKMDTQALLKQLQATLKLESSYRLNAVAEATRLKAELAAERERADKAEKECARLHEAFALRWDAIQSAETQVAVAAERERSQADIVKWRLDWKILFDENERLRTELAAERERCAKKVEVWFKDYVSAKEVAATIRKGDE